MKYNNVDHTATFIHSKITATISIAFVLFLIGLVIMITLFARNLSHYVKENLIFSIVLEDKMNEAEINSLQKKLTAKHFVKSAVYVSKEQAAKELIEELGENPEIFLGYNPLSALIEVNLKSEYANSDSIILIEKDIRGLSSNIHDTLYRKDLINSLNENIRKIGIMLLSLAVVLLFISFALINNTIRLTIYSNRFIINSMKLVGATNVFIRKPFIRSNIRIGFLAAILAIGMISSLLYYLSLGIQDLFKLVSVDALVVVGLSVIVIGILISFFATSYSVNKYLKMDVGELYYV